MALVGAIAPWLVRHGWGAFWRFVWPVMAGKRLAGTLSGWLRPNSCAPTSFMASLRVSLPSFETRKLANNTEIRTRIRQLWANTTANL